MNKNKMIGFSIIIGALLIGALFLVWIVILPLTGVTDFVSNSITSGYWGIAIFTLFEIVVLISILIWVGSTAFRTKENSNQEEQEE